MPAHRRPSSIETPPSGPGGLRRDSTSGTPRLRRDSTAGTPPRSSGSFSRGLTADLVLDPLPSEQLTLLKVPAAQRDKPLLDKLVKLTQALAGEYFGTLSEDQHLKLARTWRYVFFRPGDDICFADQECTTFFIVLAGQCEVQERQVHHLEGRRGTDGFGRKVVARAGRAFGHYPLVHGDSRSGSGLGQAWGQSWGQGWCHILSTAVASARAWLCAAMAAATAETSAVVLEGF